MNIQLGTPAKPHPVWPFEPQQELPPFKTQISNFIQIDWKRYGLKFDIAYDPIMS